MYLRWFEWVVRWEVNSDQKHATSIWAIWWTHNRRLPVEHIFGNRACRWTKKCILVTQWFDTLKLEYQSSTNRIASSVHKYNWRLLLCTYISILDLLVSLSRGWWPWKHSAGLHAQVHDYHGAWALHLSKQQRLAWCRQNYSTRLNRKVNFLLAGRCNCPVRPWCRNLNMTKKWPAGGRPLSGSNKQT